MRPVSRATLALFLLLVSLAWVVSGCAGASAPPPTTGSSTSSLTTASTAAVSTSSTPVSTTRESLSTTTSTSTTIPVRVSRSLDVAGYTSALDTEWFHASADDLAPVEDDAEATFRVGPRPVQNRSDGAISPTLVSSYVFMQFGEIGAADLAEHAGTLDALFIRSASIGFVDYLGNRAFDWDRRSARIPLAVESMIAQANKLGIPVFLELNYTNYIPGDIGTGVEALAEADNAGRTVSYIENLQKRGLRIDGVTFGDEIEDESGYGELKPTVDNSDLVARFVSYANTLRRHFPALKIYAFDSYIAATRGQVWRALALLQQVRDAELAQGVTLLDGFVFRESYVYTNEEGKTLSSQDILDDVESLAGSAPVKRYDVSGNRDADADSGYLVTLADGVDAMFERRIDIGITEYLPAGPVQIDESDTSPYQDIDMLIHYADVVGTYAELGLDVVSTWMFANTPEDSKCYISKTGQRGLNYPVHEQLAQNLAGTMLEVERPVAYNELRVKVYAAQTDETTFLVVLNKDVRDSHTIRIVLPGEYDLSLRLPARSYTSLLLEGDAIAVSGIAAASH
jgi:hypothetical protein